MFDILVVIGMLTGYYPLTWWAIVTSGYLNDFI